MTDPIQEQLIAARRNQILDAATELFAEQGFNKTTVRKVAQRAGVADGTIYNYFKNKNDLLMGILHRLNESELRDLHFEEGREQSFETFLPEYMEKRMREMAQYAPALRAIIPQLIIDEELREQMMESMMGPTIEISNRYFGDLIAKGEIRDLDPMLVSTYILIITSGFMIPAVFGHEAADQDFTRGANMLADLILNGIGKQKDETNEQTN